MRVAAQSLGHVGFGALRLSGIRGLGYSDTDTLPAGTVITFGVHSDTCGLTFDAAADITAGLNNWTSQMMQINSVTNTLEGEIPGIVDVTVNATVTNAILGGTLRGQIVAALAAMTGCTLSLLNNTLNAASGGTAAANTCPPGTTANAQGVCLCSNGQVPNSLGVCTSTIPWTTIAIAAGAGLVGLIVLMVVIRR
jgi:hypothetical protein